MPSAGRAGGRWRGLIVAIYNRRMATLTLFSGGAEATRQLGAALGRVLRPGSLILLDGPLGAGKTTLAQGIAAGLGVTEPVVSPSFTLVREYVCAAGQRLVHMDFYRLSGNREVVDLGIEDYLGTEDIVVIEWPERAGHLGCATIRVSLAPDGNHRRITITLEADGESARALREAVNPWATP